MSKMQKVTKQKSNKPLLSINEKGFQLEAVNGDGGKLTTHLEFVDSNIAFGSMTKEGGRIFEQHPCIWIAEDEKTPTIAESHIKNLNNFFIFSNWFIFGTLGLTVAAAFFSLWSLFFFPLMMIAYIAFVHPRKPVTEIGLGPDQRIELQQKGFNIHDDATFKKVLLLPNAHEFTTHIRRMVNMIGVKRIDREYFLNWLNVAVKIMDADNDSSPDLIPFGLEDAQEVLRAILEHNKKVKIKEATERAQQKADNAVLANFNADVTEKQIAEHSLRTKQLALARVNSLDRQIFGEE